MTQFTYDLCLLYKVIEIDTRSDVVRMQTDDTLLLVDQSFVALKKKTIKSAKIMIKDRERLTSENSLKFNEIRIERLNKAIYFRQKTHIQDIQLMKSIESFTINAREKVRINLNLREQYIIQRARDVYLATICQFETTFDLFYAAQSIESTFSLDDIIILNKRLK